MKNSLLLDKNIVIDIIAGRLRRPKILEILQNFEKIFISTHTFTTCFYILRKDYSKEEIYQHLSQFEILEINQIDCHLAFSLAKNLDDIEDCLEICTAKRNQVKIITADKKMLLNYGDVFDMIEID